MVQNTARVGLKFNFLCVFKHEILLDLLYRKRSISLEDEADKAGAHSYKLLQSQIWALLPCFCNNPTDLKDNFKVCTVYCLNKPEINTQKSSLGLILCSTFTDFNNFSSVTTCCCCCSCHCCCFCCCCFTVIDCNIVNNLTVFFFLCYFKSFVGWVGAVCIAYF